MGKLFSFFLIFLQLTAAYPDSSIGHLCKRQLKRIVDRSVWRLPKPNKGTIAVVDLYSSGGFITRKLRERGYKVIHVKSSPTVHKGFSARKDPIDDHLVHETYVFDGYKNKLQNLLQKHDPDFVIPGTETGVELAWEMGGALGKNDGPANLAKLWRNKHLMQSKIKAAGLDGINEAKVSSFDQATSEMTRLNIQYPVMAKQVAGVGTDGSVKCANEEELEAAFKKLIGSHSKYTEEKVDEILVQEYLEGPEHVVDGVGLNGSYLISDMLDYEKKHVEGAGDMYDIIKNSAQSGQRRREIIEYTKKVLKALQLKNGAFHAEVKWVEGRGPVLIEVGARMAGAKFPMYMQKLYKPGETQLDLLIEAMVDSGSFKARIDRGQIIEPQRTMYFVWLNAPKAGLKVNRRKLRKFLQKLKSFYHLEFHIGKNARTKKTIDLPSSVGHAVLMSDDEEELKSGWRAIRAFERDELYSD